MKTKEIKITKTRRTETPLEISAPEKVNNIRCNPPVYMTLAEAACYCGFSPRSLRQYLRYRLISRIKIGGRILFRRETLDSDLSKLQNISK